MTDPSHIFDTRYLAAKKSIDDRALNKRVWHALRRTLRDTHPDRPVRVTELGAGIGTMLERTIEWNLLQGQVAYRMVDSDLNQLDAARRRLTGWAEQRGHTLDWSGNRTALLRAAGTALSLNLEHTSIEAHAAMPAAPSAIDLLLAHGVLDLVDFRSILPSLLHQLSDNGLVYLTCNFDGVTRLSPSESCDDEIFRRYHESMETRLPGASRTGSRLSPCLRLLGLEIMAEGDSDWNIRPADRGYPADERFFLSTIIGMVEREVLQSQPPLPAIAAWARTRRLQIETSRLSLRASHRDILARKRLR